MGRSKTTAADMRRMWAWAKVVKGLIEENNSNAAAVADAADIDRNVFYNFLRGEGSLSLPKLERSLEFLGHELDAIKIAPQIAIRQRERPLQVATRCTGGR